MGYSYTWTGASIGDSTSWSDAANWTVSPSGGTYPGTGPNDAVDIPGGLSFYPDIQTGESFNIASLTVETGASLAIDSAGFLAVSGTASVIGTINLNGNLTVSGTAGVSGIINLAGGNLTSAGITLNSGILAGTGTVGGPLDGTGTVSAQGGLLLLTGYVDSTGSATSIVVESGSTAFLSSGTGVGSASVSVNLSFGSGDHAVFKATNAAMNTVHIAPIVNFSGTDEIVLKASSTQATDDQIFRDAANSSITIKDSSGNALQTFYFASGTDIASVKLNAVDVAGKDTLTICFMPGTLIRTPEGEAPIETLQRGVLVLTAEGDARPIVWVGRQTIVSRFADPVHSWPIRVAASALAENVPSRDLLVSPDHALLVDGILAHAGALINGTSIRREQRVPAQFVYYHVELEDHSLILAENVPAETFVDNVDRRNFDNWEEHQALYPEGRPVEELPLPRAKSRRQLPKSIRVALDERAAGMAATAAA
jgi:hypothetical protein